MPTGYTVALSTGDLTDITTYRTIVNTLHTYTMPPLTINADSTIPDMALYDEISPYINKDNDDGEFVKFNKRVLEIQAKAGKV